jgi:hypothetical protein
MSDITPFILEDKAFSHFKEYPKSLGDSWVLLTIFDEKNSLGGVCSLYFDERHPKGTIIISKKILNDYPDAFATFDKDGSFNRIYTSPKFRGSGIIKSLGMILRTLLYDRFNIYLSIAKTNNKAGLAAMKSGVREIIKAESNDEVVKSKFWKEQQNSSETVDLDLMEYRDPISPSYWHGIRYNENKEY